MTVSRKFWLVILAIGLLALVPAAMAGPPHFITLDFQGAVATYAFGINPAGDIVGSYVDSSGDEHGFALRNGNFTSFDYPASVWTEGWGITPQGDIVGQYGLADKTIHGFLLRNGSFFPIDVPGQPTNLGPANTMPVRISPDGTIVGCYHQSTPNGTTILDTMYGFVMNAEGVTSYPLARTMHNGVNPSGAITGNYFDPATGRVLNSYIIANGVTSWFSFPGAFVTRAWDISATGDVVGWYRDSPLHNFHGFLLHRGELTSIDVDLPGVTRTFAIGINPEGDIVGYYTNATGDHGFLLTKRGGE
jgi:uncharacterized membrane protein